MASILAFAGSNSSNSVNFKLVKHTASLVSTHKIQTLNMVNFPFPMFSENYEKEHGYSNSLVELKNDIQSADGLILSVNEHNGNLSAYFKNLIDWLSRLERKFLEGTNIMLMSASPGGRGGIGAQTIANDILSRFGGNIITTFSLPGFHGNFDPKKGIVDDELATAHQKALDGFLNSL